MILSLRSVYPRRSPPYPGFRSATRPAARDFVSLLGKEHGVNARQKDHQGLGSALSAIAAPLSEATVRRGVGHGGGRPSQRISSLASEDRNTLTRASTTMANTAAH